MHATWLPAGCLHQAEPMAIMTLYLLYIFYQMRPIWGQFSTAQHSLVWLPFFWTILFILIVFLLPSLNQTPNLMLTSTATFMICFSNASTFADWNPCTTWIILYPFLWMVRCKCQLGPTLSAEPMWPPLFLSWIGWGFIIGGYCFFQFSSGWMVTWGSIVTCCITSGPVHTIWYALWGLTYTWIIHPIGRCWVGDPCLCSVCNFLPGVCISGVAPELGIGSPHLYAVWHREPLHNNSYFRPMKVLLIIVVNPPKKIRPPFGAPTQ